jgi:hypothetical protein
VSHFVERKENNCLNCGAEVIGRYCHVCGQENIEPKETFWHLVTHFVYDITHFDGKFFSTVKSLLTKPGFLSKEYIKGKRASYLNPIKMYVFISAFFFLFFFSIFKTEYEPIKIKTKNPVSYEEVRNAIENKIKQYKKDLEKPKISAVNKSLLENKIPLLQQDLERIDKDTTDLKDLNYYQFRGSSITKNKYRSIEYYDSVQKALPIEQRDVWIAKVFTKKGIELELKYGQDWVAILKMISKKLLHSFPQILFVSLPIFALMLKILYFRKKNFYYVDHVIFTVHLYCAMFILMFFYFLFVEISHVRFLGWFDYLGLPLIIYIIWYHYRGLRSFYEQSRSKTVFKYLILLFISQFLITTLLGIVFLFLAFTA